MAASDDMKIPERFWQDLELQIDLQEFERAKTLTALGLDLNTYCPANKHRWVDTIGLHPVPLTDHLEPYCSACEQGKAGQFGV